MSPRLNLLLACVLPVIALSSCYNNKADKLYAAGATTCDTTSVTYTATIRPIIISNCTQSGGCHNAADASGGYDMTTYQGVFNATQDGHFKSDLLGTTNPMPKNTNQLPACELSQIFMWVDAGALEN